jgi:hypothetical protein
LEYLRKVIIPDMEINTRNRIIGLNIGCLSDGCDWEKIL